MYLGKAEVFHSLSSFRHDNHFSLCKTLTPTACDAGGAQSTDLAVVGDVYFVCSWANSLALKLLN